LKYYSKARLFEQFARQIRAQWTNGVFVMKSVRFLSATALASAAIVAPHAAYAQTAAPTPEACNTDPNLAGCVVRRNADGSRATGDEIVVTGSRIPRPEIDGVLPGVQVGGEQISTRGFTNALEAVNDIPLVGPGASPLTGNNGGQAASLGAAFVDLLDLGTSRTLTLVNGRRYVSGNAASLFVESNATGSQVDVNTIPAALISRIDIVTVGGAAAYGADAIAGVVNYILKDDHEGTEVFARAGLTGEGDAGTQSVGVLTGVNLLDNRLNITVSGEYNHSDGLQADARDFRLRRANTITNFGNGARRNAGFGSAIIDVVGANNGAFLRGTDDGVPASLYGEGFINQTLSFNGTILNTLAAPNASYTPISAVVNGATRTSNFISFDNGVGASGLAIATPLGNITTQNLTNFNTATQLVNGLPGATANGLNTRTTPIAGLPITTFAPTALPAGVTPAQVFTQFSITPPAQGAGVTAGQYTTQLSTLAINVLQANRPTAREFFAANPSVNANYFIGTFIPNLPRIANTDTTLVTVAGVQVPVNQVLPFVAVPLEFNTDGSVRPYTATTLTPTTPGTIAQSPGSNGGFSRAIENIVLRTGQDRYIANLNGRFDITPDITLFTENLYAKVASFTNRNSPNQNFVTTGEAAALVVNVNNPYLSASSIAALNAVGINAATRGGSFAITRQNQDIFENNPFRAESETMRLVGGIRAKGTLFGRDFKAELSATYGQADSTVNTTSIKDIEYQLALDSARDANGVIRCRSQLFPGQYLGRTPVGTVANLTRVPGAGGLATETVVTPTITQDMINACQPLNPFGYNQMSDASKNYVKANIVFKNRSTQTFLQGSLTSSLIDLPAGPLGVSGTAEYRRETLTFASDEINRLGRGRAAPSAQTAGTINVWEAGGEVRIPIFGEDFLPFFGNLEISPAIRITRQFGSAPQYRNLAGQIVSPRASGDPETIWSIGGTWRPIRDIQFRGNITRSIRQPSIVELFLGGQPAFAAPTDPCSPANIASGNNAANRRTNCRAAVIGLGLATDPSTADAFLANYVANPAALPGTFSGAAGLKAERGKSYTFGVALTPRWIPGLSLSADYINLDLSSIIQPTNLAQALQFCYDSKTFPDTSPQTGANTCQFFSRQGADFQVAPGFASGFINLAATQIRAWNLNAQWKFSLPSELGNVTLKGNAYHLKRFSESPAGDFTDSSESAGTFNRPKWEVQGSLRYEKGGFYSQATVNWSASTKVFVAGLPGTIENFPNVVYPAYATVDFTVGADVNDNVRLQLAVTNLTNKNYAGETGLAQGAYVDQIGRRFQFFTKVKF
jgi:outer membrane receptor protein involved in Fe transport